MADAKYASRKFLLAVLVLLAAGAARVFGLLEPELAVDLVKWTLGLYFGANVGASAVAWLTGKGN
jgi:hypothetical protein